MKKNRTIIEIFAVAAVLGLFCFLVLHRIGDIVYFCEDELIKEAMALKFISLFTGKNWQCWAYESLISFRGVADLIMFRDYIGYPPVYLASIFIWILSDITTSFFALKLTCVFVGTVSLFFIYMVLRRWVGRAEAWLTVFFLSVNNMYILAVRSAYIREEVFQIFGFWFGLFLISRINDRNRNWLLYCAVFVFGVTLWAKIMFMGYLLGALLGFFVLGERGFYKLRTMFFSSIRESVAVVGVFCLGALPFIYFNCIANYTMFRFFLRSFSPGVVGPSEHVGSWSNLDFFTNLIERFYNAWMYLGGSMFLTRSFNPVFPVFFLCALCWAVWYVLKSARDDKLRNVIVFIITGYFFILVMSSFIISIHSPEHLILMVPFFELLCALFVVWLSRRIAGRGRAVFISVVCLLFLAGQAVPWVKYADAMNVRRGAAFMFQSEKEELLASMKEYEIDRVVASPVLGWLLKTEDSLLDVRIIPHAFKDQQRRFMRSFGGLRGQWWVMFLIFDADKELFEMFQENGLCSFPEKVIVFRDRDDCAVAFIKLNQNAESAER